MSEDQNAGKTENEKLLGLMAYWLFGTFVIVFAAITVYIGLFVGNPIEAVTRGAPIWLITGAVALVLFFGYKFWLERKSS